MAYTGHMTSARSHCIIIHFFDLVFKAFNHNVFTVASLIVSSDPLCNYIIASSYSKLHTDPRTAILFAEPIKVISGSILLF